MDEDQKKMNPLYKWCDVEGLATVLAEDDWKIATESVDTNDLYETIVSSVQGNGEITIGMQRQPKSHWATLYFDLFEEYKKLILTYCLSEDNVVD